MAAGFDLLALSEALVAASPLVTLLFGTVAGWKGCQHFVVKWMVERYSADLADKTARIHALEQRETELMRIALRKLEGG